jgi:hypothetical protein
LFSLFSSLFFTTSIEQILEIPPGLSLVSILLALLFSLLRAGMRCPRSALAFFWEMGWRAGARVE